MPMELTEVARKAKYFWGCDESNLQFFVVVYQLAYKVMESIIKT